VGTGGTEDMSWSQLLPHVSHLAVGLGSAEQAGGKHAPLHFPTLSLSSQLFTYR